MNIALLFHSGFTSSLRSLRHWCTPQSAQPWAPPSTNQAGSIDTPQVANRCVMPTRSESHKFALRRPLRVVRVLEVGQPRSTVGRMVISGCMADVCAELDRLAAREAALS